MVCGIVGLCRCAHQVPIPYHHQGHLIMRLMVCGMVCVVPPHGVQTWPEEGEEEGGRGRRGPRPAARGRAMARQGRLPRRGPPRPLSLTILAATTPRGGGAPNSLPPRPPRQTPKVLRRRNLSIAIV